MKKCIKGIILFFGFVLIFCFLFQEVQEMLREKTYGKTDMVHCLYDIKPNTLDVLFVGSSHAYYSISPNQLWEEKGYTAALEASPSQSPCLSYYVIKDMLNRHNIKVIFIETYGMKYDKRFCDNVTMRRVLDAMPMSVNKVEAIRDWCKEMPFNKLMTCIFPISLYHSRWSSIDIDALDPGQNEHYLRGELLSTAIRDYVGCDPISCKPGKIIPEHIEYMDKIIDLAKEKGAQVVLYASPMTSYTKGPYKRYRSVMLSVKEYADKRGVPFLFLEDRKDIVFNYADDFKDAGHMSYLGKAKISSYLGDYLEKHYELTDHRGDPAYESYQKDWEKYHEQNEELMESVKDGSNRKSHRKDSKNEQADEPEDQ